MPVSDALNGCLDNGHYYLALHGGGQLTEVSRAAFEYSRWHAYSLLILLASGMVLLLSRALGPRADGQRESPRR
jgi:hypothetical protein